MVDSVNVLFGVITGILTGDFSAFHDPEKMRYLKIISVFTAGSAFGLVSISHVLGYVLKRYHQIVIAVIIGFITGSLGIVWPWKEKVFKQLNGQFLVDQKGEKIIENYKRFIPDVNSSETWMSILFILIGVVLILSIDFYGRQRKK